MKRLQSIAGCLSLCMGLISVPDVHASVNLDGLTPVGVTTVDRQSSWESLTMGAPIADDDASDSFGVRATAFPSEAALPVLNDGLAATQDNDPVQSVSFSGDGYFGLTLPGRTDVEKINTYSRKDGSAGNEAARQLFTLWGSNVHELPDPVFTNGLTSGWEYIAQVNTTGAFNGGLHGSSVADAGGGALGTYRHLLWIVESQSPPTLFAEVDVIAVDKGYPKFSWDNIPLNAHIGSSYVVPERDVNGDPIPDKTDIVHGFTVAETAELAARYDFITLTGGSWAGEYFDEVEGAEEVYSQAALDIKALNPDAKILFYWPPDILKPHHSQTLHQESPAQKFVWVNEECEYLAVADPQVRNWWADIAGRAITQYNCDGVYMDGFSSHTPGHPSTRWHLSVAENEVLNNLRFTMWEEARVKMGPVGMQILNPVQGGMEHYAGTGGHWDHLMATDGAMMDDFIRADMDTLDDSHFVENIVTLSTGAKEGKVMILKAWPEFNNTTVPYDGMTDEAKNQLLYERREFPLACFLIGAGKYSYLSYAWSFGREAGYLNSWGSGLDAKSMTPIPEYEKSLGAPLGDYDRYGLVFTREFENAFVYVDIKTRESHIEWGEDYTNLIVMSSALINSEYAGSLSEALPGASGFSKIDGPAWVQVAADGSLRGTPVGSDLGMNYLNVSYSDGQATNGTVRILVLNRSPVADAGTVPNVTLTDTGPWTPEDLPQCTAWYDAADAATITASGGRVSQWDDKSSNGYHMTQATEANQPTNQPGEYVSFSGGGYYLNNANALANAIDYNNATVIMMLNANDASGCLLGNAYGGLEMGVAARFPTLFGIGTLFGSSSGLGPTIGSDEITSMFNNPFEERGVINVFADEKLTEANEPGLGVPTDTSFSLGTARALSAYSCDAYLREVIIASGLSTLDRQKVEGYLAHKWEMSANLSAEHPFKAVAPGGIMVSATLSGVGNDPDGDAVSAVWSMESGPGEVSFADPYDFNTAVTFYFPGTYTLQLVVSDEYGLTDSDTVTVTVEWDGQFPPVADPQSVSVEDNTFVDITLTGSDWEGSNLTYSVGTPTHGVLTGTAPDLTYTPDTDYTGPDSFTFTVNDGETNSAPATVSISVHLQSPPVADPQSIGVVKNTSLDITLTGSDPEGSNLTYSVTDTLTNGVLTGTAPDLTYTPNSDYEGADSFTFTVNDGETNSAPATVSIVVFEPTLYSEDFTADPGYVASGTTSIGDVGGAGTYFTFGQYAGANDIGVTTGTGVLHIDSNTTGSSARSRGLSVFIDTSAAVAGTYSVSFDVSNWVAGTGSAGFKAHEGSGLDTGYIDVANASNSDLGNTPDFSGTATSTKIGYTGAGGGAGITGNGTVSFYVQLTEAGQPGDYLALAFTQVRSTSTALAPTFDVDNVLVVAAVGNQAPVFKVDPINKANAVKDSAYSGAIGHLAYDLESDPMTFSKASGPAWLSVGSNGVLSGTPAAGDVGANVFTVQVDATGGSDTATLNITVDANQAPAFTADPINKANGDEDVAYNGSIAGDASDPESDPMTFSKTSGPAWLSVGSNGVLSGTPAAGDAGANVFTVQVDAAGGSDTATLNITVDVPITPLFYEEDFSVDPGYVDGVTTSIGAAGGAGTTFTFGQYNGASDIAVTTSTGVLHIDQASSGTRNRGLSVFIDTSAAVAGTYTVSFDVSNWTAGAGTTDGYSGFKVFEGSGLASGYLDLDTGDNNTNGATPKRTAGTAPAWIDLGNTWGAGTTGSGITGNGTVSFDVVLTEAGQPGDYLALAWVQVMVDSAPNFDVDNVLVAAPNQAPAFTVDPINKANGDEDVAYSGSIAGDASDQESDPMTFSKTSGPAWLSVASNGALSGTPAAGDVGANVFTVQVDATGGSDTATLNITVDATPVNQAPAFTADPINKANGDEDGTYSGSIAGDASDPESDPMTFSKASGPAWLSVASNGALSGTPAAGDVGANVFTVQVDATGGSDTATLNITVDAPPLYEEDFSTDPGYVGNGTTSIGADTNGAGTYFTFGQYNGSGDIGETTDSGVLHIDSNTAGGGARSRGLSVFIDTSAATAGTYTVSFDVSNWVDGTGSAGFKVFEGSGLDIGYLDIDNGDNALDGVVPKSINTSTATWIALSDTGAGGTGITGNGTVSFTVELTEAGQAGDYLALAWTQVRTLGTALAPTFDVDNVLVEQPTLVLASMFSHNMILQREKSVPVWGTSEPGAAITVEFAGQTNTITAAGDGTWRVDLDPMVASTNSRTLTVTAELDSNTEVVTCNNVLVGEVWLCSGQSNMELRLSTTDNGAAVVAAATHPTLRLCMVPIVASSNTPLERIDADWSECTPGTVGDMSGVAYYFARKLQTELDVPVGIINSSKGGAEIELWYPDSGEYFNGMIAAQVPFAMRGVIWYQGENNVTDGMLYVDKKKTLVEAWRALWGYDFPFYYVQIAPFNYGGGRAGALPYFWEAQSAILDEIPGTGMAVITDTVVNLEGIHPSNKEPVGQRLALLALDNTYGQDIVSTGPTFQSVRLVGTTLEVTFDSAVGLTTSDAEAPDLFELAGDDGTFVPATATIDEPNGKVTLSNTGVALPVSMRFAWSQTAQPNLRNGAGLVPAAFRATSPRATWLGDNSLTDSDWASNADGDSLNNLLEFAFGTDPAVSDGGSIAYGSGVTPGLPVPILETITSNNVEFRAAFGRRKDWDTAGLTYTVQFSADLTEWVDSADTPLEIESGSGDIDAVYVPYPLAFPTSGGDEKAQFFRLNVSQD